MPNPFDFRPGTHLEDDPAIAPSPEVGAQQPPDQSSSSETPGPLAPEVQEAAEPRSSVERQQEGTRGFPNDSDDVPHGSPSDRVALPGEASSTDPHGENTGNQNPGPTTVTDRTEAPEAVPSTPRVIAVANQKGGVGKTTTTVNLGATLAELGLRVLIVDLDPQGNATTGLGINYRILDETMYDVMLSGLPIDDCIEPTEVKGLFVAPASLDLAGAEVELVSAYNRESKLARTLDEVSDQYDYILIDCPPSLGLLTVNGLVAANEVMVPIQCEYYALEGLAQLTRNIELIRDNLNPSLHIGHIVMVMYDNRTKLAGQVVSEVRDHFGSIVCKNMIPRNVKLSEAPSFGQPITTYATSSRGAVAYRELAREVSGVS